MAVRQTMERREAMRKLDRVRELRHIMWRNVPGDGVQPTNAACERCHKGSARGGGLCFDCAVDELSELVGSLLAVKYATSIRKIRQVEEVMDRQTGGYDVV